MWISISYLIKCNTVGGRTTPRAALMYMNVSKEDVFQGMPVSIDSFLVIFILFLTPVVGLQ